MKITLYTADFLKIKEPKEGFQNGGWYNGHQHYFGTFSEQGVLHPLYEIFSQYEITMNKKEGK